MVCRLVSLHIWPWAATGKASSTIVFVGTYTGTGPTDSKGIYAFSLDESKPALVAIGLAAATPMPSYIMNHPSGKYLYAVNEIDDGLVSAFEIDWSQPGQLKLINQQSSRGSGPCYLSSNRAGDHIFVANYNNATVAVLPLDVSTGAVKPFTGFDQQTGSSVDPDRQRFPHAHCILLDKQEQFALSANLGSDQIYQYRFSAANGSITRTVVTPVARPGDGPRHLILSANDKFVYVLNELKSTITVYNYFPQLRPVQTISTLPPSYTLPSTGAELLLSPMTGKFLYASNRGHNSIAVFSVDSVTGFLSLIQIKGVQGDTPRNFNISPSGKFMIVANQDSNSLVLFAIDPTTGKLEATGSTASVPRPTCVKYAVQG